VLLLTFELGLFIISKFYC